MQFIFPTYATPAFTLHSFHSFFLSGFRFICHIGSFIKIPSQSFVAFYRFTCWYLNNQLKRIIAHKMTSNENAMCLRSENVHLSVCITIEPIERTRIIFIFILQVDHTEQNIPKTKFADVTSIKFECFVSCKNYRYDYSTQ